MERLRIGRWSATLLAAAVSACAFGVFVGEARAQVGGPATITLDPPAETNTVGEQHCVTATVRDALGTELPGVSVRFSRSGANGAQAATRTTNAAGQATFCYTGSTAGADTIRAFADGDGDGTQDAGEPAAAATKTYVAAAPSSVNVSPGTAANDAGEEHCVRATVRDRFANRVPGVTVRFTVSGANTAAGADVTDLNGQADFCYTGTRAGTDTIRAHADTNNDLTEDPGEPVGQATKLYRPGPSVAATLTPPADTNPVGSEHCVTARALDVFGNARTGARIVFSVTGAHSTGGAVTTGTDGNAVFCYRGTRLGADAISGFHDKDDDNRLDAGEPIAAAEKTWVPGPPVLLVLSPKVAVATVGSRHCVTATATDVFGNPTPGVRVRFAVAGARTTSGEATTSSSGEATFCYTGPNLPGLDAIRAFADLNRDRVQDAGEPFDVAEKTWILPESTPGCGVSLDNHDDGYVNEGGKIETLLLTRARFAGHASFEEKGQPFYGHQAYWEYGLGWSFRSLEILALACTDREATIYGRGLINQTDEEVLYRIRVEDNVKSPWENNGEPTDDAYEIELSNGYTSGARRPLEYGNIAIH